MTSFSEWYASELEGWRRRRLVAWASFWAGWLVICLLLWVLSRETDASRWYWMFEGVCLGLMTHGVIGFYRLARSASGMIELLNEIGLLSEMAEKVRAAEQEMQKH